MKKVLLGSLYSEGYIYFIPAFVKYVLAEKENYPDLDVLVILSNVSPGTVRDWQELSQMYPLIRYKDIGIIPNPNPLKPNFDAIVQGRNTLFKEATKGGYDALYFLDFDTNPKAGALSKLVVYLSIPGVVIVGGNYKYRGQLIPNTEFPTQPIVGDFPVRDDPKFIKEVRKKGWTERVRALGFGFTLIAREVFSNPKYKLNTDFLKEGTRGTEDYPICDRLKKDGKKLIWANVRAKHLVFNREKNRLEAW